MNLDQIYEGAREAGVDIEASARVEVKTDPLTGGELVSVAIPIHDQGQITSGGDAVVWLHIYQEELDWKADTSYGDTHTSIAARSARQAVVAALSSIVDGSGGLIFTAPAEAGGPTTGVPPIDSEDIEVQVDHEEGSVPSIDGWEPDIVLYQRREETPYTGGDVEEVPRDPVVRGVPSQDDDGEDEENWRSVSRVPVEPEFDEPRHRRPPSDDDSMLEKLVKFGVPLLAAILLVIGGINIFGGTEPEPAEITPPEATEEPTEGVVQGGGQGQDPEEADEEDPAVTPPSEEETPPGPAINLIDLAQIGLTGGNGAPVMGGNDFNAFYRLLFIPEEVLPESLPASRYADVEERIFALVAAMYDEEPFSRTGVLANQFFSEPAETDVPAQQSVGYAVKVGEATFDISLAGSGPGYTEVIFGRMTFCLTFPGCEGSTLVLISLGGGPNLDIEDAHADARKVFDDRGAAAAMTGYEWILEIDGGVEQVP